jgi:hypothetical protein
LWQNTGSFPASQETCSDLSHSCFDIAELDVSAFKIIFDIAVV